MLVFKLSQNVSQKRNQATLWQIALANLEAILMMCCYGISIISDFWNILSLIFASIYASAHCHQFLSFSAPVTSHWLARSIYLNIISCEQIYFICIVHLSSFPHFSAQK